MIFTIKFQEEEAKLNDEFQKTVQDYIKKTQRKNQFRYHYWSFSNGQYCVRL
jgi:protein-S-isoprenylcysteine O-methyltransferase Ste14